MNTDKVLETLEAAGIQTNAAPMGTGKTGEGAELVPAEAFAKETLEIVPNYSALIADLPGNLSRGGARLPKVVQVPVIGSLGYFNAGSEKTSGAFAVSAGGTAPTGKVTVTQAKFTLKIDVTDELETYQDYPENLQAALKERVAAAMGHTIEALLLNADSVTAATGNVNSDDAAPTAGTYYLNADNGVRKVAIAAGTAVAVGTLDAASFADVVGKLGDFAVNPADIALVFNRATYQKALTVSEFLDASKNGKTSTIGTGAITNTFGSDVYMSQNLGKTEADGKISATPANNTKGQFVAIWKPGVKFGFGKDLTTKMFDFGADGYQLHAWFYFGMGIYNDNAGQGCAVASGINITL